jgi:hypothetical protein
MQDASDDELFIRPKLAEDARGLGRVTVVGTSGTEIPRGLLDSVEHG